MSYKNRLAAIHYLFERSKCIPFLFPTQTSLMSSLSNMFDKPTDTGGGARVCNSESMNRSSRQRVHIEHDLVGYIPLDELLKAEQA